MKDKYLSYNMQILHITGKMDPRLGGVGQAIRTMIKGLAELGLQNEVVCLDAPDAPFLADEAIVIHTPGLGKGPWCYSSRLVPWLRNNLDRFDVVVVHGLWSYHGFAVRRAIRFAKSHPLTTMEEKRKVPRVFIMPHGMLDPYFQLASGRKLKAVRNWSYWKLIEGKILSEADGVLFTCKEEQRLARKPFHPYKPKRETVVGLGVQEPPPFTTGMRDAFLAKCPRLGNDSYLLFLSRIHEKKGVDMLITAYKNFAVKLLAKHAGTSQTDNKIPKLVIAGPGLETAYGQKLQKLVLESPELKDAVLFTGMLNGDSKWGAFYGCNAFVLPSHQENFGIALVEAMACCKPVLISNQVNIFQEVIDSGGGIVAEDTLEGTQRLLDSWELLSNEARPLMGLRARRCFEQHFAMSSAAKGLLDAVRYE